MAIKRLMLFNRHEIMNLKNIIKSALCLFSTFIILLIILVIPQQSRLNEVKASTDPSGQDMPVGDLPGWHQIFTEEFNTNCVLGSWLSTYGNTWRDYGDGVSDTSGNGQYWESKVLTVNNGLLNWYVHTENGIHMVATPIPIFAAWNGSYWPGQLYGRYTVRFRADSLYGYKTAFLLWPDSNNWPQDGEIDFPEGDLDGTIGGAMHWQGGTSGNSQDYFTTSTTYSSWHTGTIEWTPSALTFYIDGNIVQQYTSISHIPDTSMHWALQVETALDGKIPSNNTSGNVQVDWVAAYSYNPTPTPTPTPLPVPSPNPQPTASYSSSITLSGTKDSSIVTVFINGSSNGVTYPDSTHWQLNNFSLSLGSNTISIYGKDASNNQTSTTTVSINRNKVGDINGDNSINLTDFSIFATDWLHSGNAIVNSLSDINSDGIVNLTDFSIFASRYGT